jgi:hypothetical protein
MKDFRRRNRIAGQFAPRTIAMLESPAYRALSLSAHRVLSRIEIERAHHAGHDNGKLPVTYEHLEEYGVHRNAIPPALRELEALGFIEVTERGRAGNAEWRRPNLYRLTYYHVDRAAPTNDWERIQTQEEADMIARAARLPRTRNRVREYRGRRGFRTMTSRRGFRTMDLPVSDVVSVLRIVKNHDWKMKSYHAVGRGRHEVSADPRAMEQRCAVGSGRYEISREMEDVEEGRSLVTRDHQRGPKPHHHQHTHSLKSG